MLNVIKWGGIRVEDTGERCRNDCSGEMAGLTKGENKNSLKHDFLDWRNEQ